MNKQELIKKYESEFSSIGMNLSTAIKFKELWVDILELDEPKKVTIPQFVADWIEACKENSAIGLYIAMNPVFLKQFNKSEELISWVRKINNQNLFARAWLDGYEVEKEKKYLVKMESLETNFNFLNRHRTENYWLFSSKDESVTYKACHTRKELEEAGFGWVFDCPGVEVEEVE